MSWIDYNAKKIVCKLVYVGPQASGKTTAIRYIYERTKDPKLEAPPMERERAAGPHYDYLPLRLGEIRGFTTHFELFSVPGGAAVSESRRVLLEKTDGIIFVADAQPNKRGANAESICELEQHLASHGFAIGRLPFVVQCNKMDLLGEQAPTDLTGWLPASLHGAEVFPSVATDGSGVFDALKAAAKAVLTELRKG